MEALAGIEVPERRGVGSVDPPLVGPSAANVTADIEAAPVEDRFNVGGALVYGRAARSAADAAPIPSEVVKVSAAISFE